MALIILLNIALAALVVGSIVALHARAIHISRGEHWAPARRPRARTQSQPQRARRLATVNG